MYPKIINKERLFVTGLSGNGSQTMEVWSEFDGKYKESPFKKIDESGYEIRFWQSRSTGKTPEPERSVHVGFLTEGEQNDDFSTLELPAANYAVFEVYVAKGYDSGNEEMEKWLADNRDVYEMRNFDGYEYVIECYTAERHKL